MFIRSLFLKNSSQIIKISQRGQSTIQLKELILKEHNHDIKQALGLQITDMKSRLESHEQNNLLVKLKAAPINPADLNIIQGSYGILPANLPASLGIEGVFEVCAVENKNSEFQIGDLVLPNRLEFPTWRSHVIDSESNFIRLPSGLDALACATLTVNPITALRMIRDFKNLKSGDTIIQNGANSSVGQAVIQLGKIFELNVVNIVRKRENQSELTEYLQSIGGIHIYTEEMLRKPELITDLWKDIPKPKLALNCVGGRATTDMVRLLDNNSVMVTYGGMSRKPLTLNTADFIFKDFQASGFWLTRWREANPKAYVDSIHELCEYISAGLFHAPKCSVFTLEDYSEAFKKNATPFNKSKCVFIG